MSDNKEKNELITANEKTPFLDHLKEIRKRFIILSVIFIIIFIISFLNAKHIYIFLVQPLQHLSNNNLQLIYTALQEAFLTYVKLAFFVSIFLILPFVFNQIWLFISPALYKHERLNFKIVFILSPILFWLGASVAYLFIIPTAWKFFLGFETINATENISINLVPKVNEYLSLSLHLIFAFAVIFLLPVFMFILVKTNLISIEKIKKYRRYVIVIAFIVSAIATPPDPLSQIIMSLVIILLYEISIILINLSNKYNKNNN